MSVEPVVIVEAIGCATVVTLNRPDRRNALNRALVGGLTAAFRAAAADASRCVILTGAGQAFCAGMDLAELAATLDQPGEAEQVSADAQRLSALYDLIYTLPKPTIAAVNGPAVAGGAGLVTVCDLAVACAGAKFGYPEVRRGLVAAMVLPHLLRHVGERAARELLLRGNLLDAEEACRVGLINAVTSGNALDAARAWAEEMCECAPQALAITKRLMQEQRETERDGGTGRSARESAAARLHVEAKDGLRSFLEKRPAAWTAVS